MGLLRKVIRQATKPIRAKRHGEQGEKKSRFKIESTYFWQG